MKMILSLFWLISEHDWIGSFLVFVETVGFGVRKWYFIATLPFCEQVQKKWKIPNGSKFHRMVNSSLSKGDTGIYI